MKWESFNTVKTNGNWSLKLMRRGANLYKIEIFYSSSQRMMDIR